MDEQTDDYIELYRISPDGNNLQRLTLNQTDQPMNEKDPVVSPGSSMIIFSVNGDGLYNISSTPGDVGASKLYTGEFSSPSISKSE